MIAQRLSVETLLLIQHSQLVFLPNDHFENDYLDLSDPFIFYKTYDSHEENHLKFHPFQPIILAALRTIK